MKVLAIDDDKNIRQILQFSLEDQFEVFMAASGAEGIEIARSEQPALILLDRMMPGMDGIATLNFLKSDPLTKEIPVVFLTAKVQQHEIEHYSRLDVCGFVPKPFDPMSIADEIKQILRSNGCPCDEK